MLKQSFSAAFSKKFDRLTSSEEQKLRMRQFLSQEGTYEDGKFIYYTDFDGKVKKTPVKYTPKEGVYRVKIFEPFYRWWYKRPIDVRFAIIPLVLSLVSGTIIYKSANFVIEREEMIIEKSRVDPNFTEENLKKWVESKKQ